MGGAPVPVAVGDCLVVGGPLGRPSVAGRAVVDVSHAATVAVGAPGRGRFGHPVRDARLDGGRHGGGMAERPPVVVHPPSPTGGRRVTVNAEILGLAYGPGDVVEFLRRAGLDEDVINLDDQRLIEWRGGGSDVWM